jgi:hypothetical protein
MVDKTWKLCIVARKVGERLWILEYRLSGA